MRLAVISVILLVTCINIIDYMVAANEMTFHVSSMVGSEDTYLQLKRRKPSLRRPGEEKLRYKEDICLAILADEFFDAHKVEMVNPNHKTIYKQVKQNHPEIHDEHFKSGFSSEVIKPKFANPYKPRDVNVNGHIVREYMFTCLAKNCSTKNIQQYFVSPEYVEGSAKTVRFVFAYNKKKELVVTAKAEKNSDSPRTETSGVTGATKAKSVETTEEPAKESEESSSYDEDDESDSW